MSESRNILLENQLNEIHENLDRLAVITLSNLKVLHDRLATGRIREIVPIDQAAVLANDKCKQTLALHALCARDLRYAMAAVRVVQDYEHVGQMLEAFHRHIERCTSSKAASLLLNFSTTISAMIDLQDAARATMLLSDDFDRLHLRVQALTAVAEAGLDAIELAVMEIILKDSARSDDLFELVLACRNLSQAAALLEAIPGEFSAFSAVPVSKVA